MKKIKTSFKLQKKRFYGGKFYDLNKEPIVCPLCSTEVKLEDIIKKRGESKVSIQDLEAVNNDEIDNSPVMSSIDVEDASDLSSDTDDMSDVIDNIEKDDSEDI